MEVPAIAQMHVKWTFNLIGVDILENSHSDRQLSTPNLNLHPTWCSRLLGCMREIQEFVRNARHHTRGYLLMNRSLGYSEKHL
jgi:hypothetical protein